MRKCRYCKKEIPPIKKSNGFQRAGYCDVDCMASHGKEKAMQARKRKESKELRQRKERIKTKPQLKKEAQIAFNAWVRWRDRGKPCISCGKPWTGEANSWDCGHYRSVGSSNHMRFNLFNAHGQCKKCNCYDSGNVVNYRLGLIERIGLEKVEQVEQDNKTRKFTDEYYRRLRDIFKKRLRLAKKRAKL